MIYTREDINNYTEDLLDPSNEEIDASEDLDVRLKTLDWAEGMVDTKIQAAAGQFSGFALKTFPGGVDAATTTNETLSGIRDLGTHRKVIGIDGLRVLVTGQTNAADNGLYLMKSGNWQRMTGYTSGASLSGLMVGVNGGDNAGKFFLQADTLSNMQADKYFQPAIDLYESLSSLVSTSREETFYAFTPIITAEPEDDESEGITQYSYDVGDLVKSSKIKRLVIQQSDYGDKTVKPTAWTYDTATGTLSVDASQVSLPEGGDLMFELVSYGTHGLSIGFVAKVINGNWYYRFANETDADLRLAGPATAVAGIQTFDTEAQATAARTGNNAIITAVRGQQSSLKVHVPGGTDEKVFTHTPRV